MEMAMAVALQPNLDGMERESHTVGNVPTLGQGCSAGRSA